MAAGLTSHARDRREVAVANHEVKYGHKVRVVGLQFFDLCSFDIDLRKLCTPSQPIFVFDHEGVPLEF